MARRLTVFILLTVVLAGCTSPFGTTSSDSPVPQNETVRMGTPSAVINADNISDTGSLFEGTDPVDGSGTETSGETDPADGSGTETSEETDPADGSESETSGETDTDPETGADQNSGSDTNNDPSDSTGADSVSPNNPWGERTLTVATDNKMNNDRQYRPLVEDALKYWEENSEQYAGYPIEYTLEPNAQNPDLVISFVSSIDDCGENSGVQGCAPQIEKPDHVSQPVDVDIQGEYNDSSTRQLIIHELGHTLGLGHGDEPQQIMSATTDLTKRPQPDVTERELPWDHSTLTVAVDQSTIPNQDREAVNEQINAALDYYAEGADGKVPDRVEFERVSNPDDADIRIKFSDTSGCNIPSGACSHPMGADVDSDDALERYVRVHITLVDLDTDEVAWHVGNRLGADAFGFDERSEFPQPLRSNAPSQTRQSRWWT